jgi:hypothetical protein
MDQALLDLTMKPFINEIIEGEKAVLIEYREYLDSLKEFTEKIDQVKDNVEQSWKRNKDRFNVFSCLTRHHLEELHSRFIAYLLDPFELHDCGDLFLKAFNSLLDQGSEEEIAIDDPGKYQFERASVRREHYCGVIEKIGTRIDIYIETPVLVIAIENKINAGEQEKQIKRTALYCKSKKKPYQVVYLTKNGALSETAGGEKYTPLSYEIHIKKWLERCLVLSAEYPVVYTGIKFYADLVDEKILNQPSNTLVMKMKDLLMEKENLPLLKYVKEFTSAANAISSELRVKFFSDVLTQLNSSSGTFMPVYRILQTIAVNTLWDRVNQGLTCFDEKLIVAMEEKYDLYFCIEHNLNNLFYGLFAVRKENRTGVNANGIQGTQQIKDFMAPRLTDIVLADGSWMCTQYFLYKGHAFGSDEMNYLLATEYESAVSSFMEEVNRYLQVWNETIEHIKLEPV